MITRQDAAQENNGAALRLFSVDPRDLGPALESTRYAASQVCPFPAIRPEDSEGE